MALEEARYPIYDGFEYRVRLRVSIPRAWGEFLRIVARHHYDGWCKESARSGVVNGLCNTACDEPEIATRFPVGWRDLDLLAKIMEQAHYHVDSAASQERAQKIDAWIDQAKAWIVAREEALATWSAGHPLPPLMPAQDS